EGVITVVADTRVWEGPVGQAVREELGKYIETLPVAEPAFTLEQFDLTTNDLFKRVIKKRKYVVFVASLDEDSDVGRYIRAGLDSTAISSIQAGTSGIMMRPNAWYRKQLVVYLIAPTAEDLIADIHAQGENLRYAFNEATRDRLTEHMFRRMRQEDLEQVLIDGHGFAVNVQYDYFIAQDTTNFVRLRRVLSDTWREFFVYYVDDADPNDLTPEWILATRDSLTKQYIRGTFEGSYVEVDRRRPVTSENIDFLDRFGYETRALWHMTGDAMGGPLVNYSFYDEEQRRIYMIDGMVFAPRYNKREFLRQVEAIAYTFRTEEPQTDSDGNGRGVPDEPALSGSGSEGTGS
ncbi:MAG: DUF4837 family protein, partial [Rhodothermia bacterium]